MFPQKKKTKYNLLKRYSWVFFPLLFSESLFKSLSQWKLLPFLKTSIGHVLIFTLEIHFTFYIFNCFLPISLILALFFNLYISLHHFSI